MRFVLGHWKADHSGYYQNGVKVNISHVQRVLAGSRDAEIVYLANENRTSMPRLGCRRLGCAAGRFSCPHAVNRLMEPFEGASRYRCADAAIGCAGIAGRAKPSGGAVALALLIEHFACSSVALYGFAGNNLSLPYHYWKDGSQSDGVSANKWYGIRYGLHAQIHQFRREHMLMHHVLGNCSWTVNAERFRERCSGGLPSFSIHWLRRQSRRCPMHSSISL